MGRGKTFRSQLQAHAVEQNGFVTRGDVQRLGVPPHHLERLVADGRLTSVCDGLYRLDGMPPSRPHRFAEAVLRVGRDAFLSHDAVLALHGLTEREPDRVRVSTPHRPAARSVPRHVEVHRREVPPEDLTTYHGIRSTTLARALVDCRDLLSAGQLAASAAEAVERGLLLRRERHAVLDALDVSLA
jgi:predicted transcriptional regulator of viral defense system